MFFFLILLNLVFLIFLRFLFSRNRINHKFMIYPISGFITIFLQALVIFFAFFRERNHSFSFETYIYLFFFIGIIRFFLPKIILFFLSERNKFNFLEREKNIKLFLLNAVYLEFREKKI